MSYAGFLMNVSVVRKSAIVHLNDLGDGLLAVIEYPVVRCLIYLQIPLGKQDQIILDKDSKLWYIIQRLYNH